MPLSDRQIERYSRQIIVPGIGGLAQERLLASRVTICGDARDIEAPLAYLVGAGIGEIFVVSDLPNPLLNRMRALNPDVKLSAQASSESVLAGFIGSDNALESFRSICDGSEHNATIVARLDEPVRIAFFPCSSPCPRCAEMLAPFTPRSETADFAAMLAAAEVFKLVAGQTHNASLIEFDGFATRLCEIAVSPGCQCITHRSNSDGR